MSEVTIRIWQGCVVRQVISLRDTGSTTIGAVGGAGNSTKVDIELDPWAGLIVDNRIEKTAPVSIREGKWLFDEDEEEDNG